MFLTLFAPQAIAPVGTLAYIKVGDTWQPATPFIKVGDTWQPAQPFWKDDGVWN